MHLHIADSLTDDDMRCLWSDHMGSSWFDPDTRRCEQSNCVHWEAFYNTPEIWVGEVSWAKAFFFKDPESFIPTTVERISELIDDRATVVIDDRFISQVNEAFEAPNNTSYRMADTIYRLADKDKVVAWLQTHKGSRIIEVSW